MYKSCHSCGNLSENISIYLATKYILATKIYL